MVITIIGILATGAIATYTTQIQKARDTTRVEDVMAIKSALDQFYSDKNVYPDPTKATVTDPMHISAIAQYMPRIPKDSKSGSSCNGGTTGTACDYIYSAISDENNIDLGAYEVSLGFENSGNRQAKADNAKDGGNDMDRLELGKRQAVIDTSCVRTATVTVAAYPMRSTTVCTAAAGSGVIITGS